MVHPVVSWKPVPECCFEYESNCYTVTSALSLVNAEECIVVEVVYGPRFDNWFRITIKQLAGQGFLAEAPWSLLQCSPEYNISSIPHHLSRWVTGNRLPLFSRNCHIFNRPGHLWQVFRPSPGSSGRHRWTCTNKKLFFVEIKAMLQTLIRIGNLCSLQGQFKKKGHHCNTRAIYR